MSRKSANRSLSDVHDTLCALEEGSSLTRYFRNKRPESRMFRVLLETRELVWMRSVGGKPEGVGMFCRHVFVMCVSTIFTLEAYSHTYVSVDNACIRLLANENLLTDCFGWHAQ